MKRKIEDENFDYSIETSDWRYNAAIVGLIKYYEFLLGKGDTDRNYLIEDDVIKYNSKKITEENYLLFVEEFFKEAMHHKVVKDLLVENEELTKEQVDIINGKLKANLVMKSTLKNITYSDENRELILNTINKNRINIIRETYRRGKSLYSNFINENSFFTAKGKVCRLLNYYIDVPKKSKSISYNWNFNTYEFIDDDIFDFIPFAFSKSYESFFINNNCDISNLLKSNELIAGEENSRQKLFSEIKRSNEYVDFDVEVIVKDRSKSYYETLYIRKKAIKIFKAIPDYRGVQFVYNIDSKNSIYMEKYVVDKILNGVRLDTIINSLLKSKQNYSYNIKTLIKINILIYGNGGEEMDKKMKGAYIAAKKVVEVIKEENKINSYRQKLISAITLNNYDKFNQILMQLTSYSGVTFNFAYDLFEDFDSNKNLAYTFINALSKNENGSKTNNGGESNE